MQSDLVDLCVIELNFEWKLVPAWAT